MRCKACNSVMSDTADVEEFLCYDCFQHIKFYDEPEAEVEENCTRWGGFNLGDELGIGGES